MRLWTRRQPSCRIIVKESTHDSLKQTRTSTSAKACFDWWCSLLGRAKFRLTALRLSKIWLFSGKPSDSARNTAPYTVGTQQTPFGSDNERKSKLPRGYLRQVFSEAFCFWGCPKLGALYQDSYRCIYIYNYDKCMYVYNNRVALMYLYVDSKSAL